MKRHIGLNRFLFAAVAIILLLTASSCSESKSNLKLHLTDSSSVIVDKMSECMSLKDILSDLSETDLFLKLETDGLECKTKKDEKESTVDYLYYDKDGNLVFIDYEGYGEDSFEYRTTSKSGLPMTVLYVDDDGKRISASATTSEYIADFKSPDKAEKYGAREVIVTSGDVSGDSIGNSVTYTIDGKNCFVSAAYFFDRDGFHRYSCSLIDGKYDEYDDVIFEKVDSIKDDSKILSLANDEAVADTEILLGNHSIKYKEISKGSREWYIIADLLFVFDESKKAESFSAAYGLEVKKSPYNDSLMTATVPKTVIPVDSSFERFGEFLATEFNDYSFESIKLTKDGKLCGFNRESRLSDYY